MIMALAIISSISAALSFISFEPNTISKVIPISLTTSSLSDDERESIIYMREEEKLARDVYRQMYAKYDLRPFRNISQAEERHMELMKDLLTKYSINDPVSSDETGSFTNTTLNDLYKKSIEQGNTSLIDALKAGALIEEVDIKDLDKQLGVTQNSDIKETYTYLKQGSENHLRAFVKNLRNHGVEYTPVELSKEEFDKIMKYESGSGNKNNNCGNCNDCCNGNYKKGKNNKGNNNGSSNRGNNFNGNCPKNNCIYR
jgi:hypothetical protein